MITTIKNQINTMLLTLTGDGQPLVDVFTEHRTNFNGYPSATFEFKSMQGAEETNTQDLRTYNYEIYVHQEMEFNGKGNANTVLAAAAEQIMTLFDKNYTLMGVCDWVKPVGITTGVYPEGAGLVAYVLIKLACVKSESIL